MSIIPIISHPIRILHTIQCQHIQHHDQNLDHIQPIDTQNLTIQAPDLDLDPGQDQETERRKKTNQFRQTIQYSLTTHVPFF